MVELTPNENIIHYLDTANILAVPPPTSFWHVIQHQMCNIMGSKSHIRRNSDVIVNTDKFCVKRNLSICYGDILTNLSEYMFLTKIVHTLNTAHHQIYTYGLP